jgi:DNA-binding PadR family transcriptional regulator
MHPQAERGDSMSEIDDRERRALPLTEATYYVLVSLVEPRHGYGIMQNVAALTGGEVRIGPGTLYGALNNLLKQGLIERSGDEETEGERRKTYGLTPLGRSIVLLECERVETLARIGRAAAERIRIQENEKDGKKETTS